MIVVICCRALFKLVLTIVVHRKIPRIVFVAIRKIDIGEELLFDYGDRSKAAVLANPWLLV
jgi:hypothetical protein